MLKSIAVYNNTFTRVDSDKNVTIRTNNVTKKPLMSLFRYIYLLINNYLGKN